MVFSPAGRYRGFSRPMIKIERAIVKLPHIKKQIRVSGRGKAGRLSNIISPTGFPGAWLAYFCASEVKKPATSSHKRPIRTDLRKLDSFKSVLCSWIRARILVLSCFFKERLVESHIIRYLVLRQLHVKLSSIDSKCEILSRK